jgi:gas vesicle protein
VTEENKGHGFLTGLIIGGVIGTALTFWLIERTGRRGRRGIGSGSRAGDLATSIKDEVSTRVKDFLKHTLEEGSDTARKTRSNLEGRLKRESEE